MRHPIEWGWLAFVLVYIAIGAAFLWLVVEFTSR